MRPEQSEGATMWGAYNFGIGTLIATAQFDTGLLTPVRSREDVIDIHGRFRALDFVIASYGSDESKREFFGCIMEPLWGLAEQNTDLLAQVARLDNTLRAALNIPEKPSASSQ